MIPRGRAGIKCEIVLSDGQRFDSIDAFAKACGMSYPSMWRRFNVQKKDPDDVAREKGLLKQNAAE